MIVGDLFSGIGGFSLAAEWMGWETAFFSEIDPYASRVLAHHWPHVPNLGDITAVDWSRVRRVNGLTAGFPCQPHSLAGKREGSNDERDLFGEIIRCADALRPDWMLLENVPGLLTSNAGHFFGRVLGSLAALGYDAEWRVLSAADVGAPHKRDRVWIVAYTAGVGRREVSERLAGESGAAGAPKILPGSRDAAMGDAGGIRREGSSQPGTRTEAGEPLHARHAAAGAASGAGRGRRWWETEPDVGRVAHGVPARVDRLRCLGNSIVPQCALEIFRAIEAREVARVAA